MHCNAETEQCGPHNTRDNPQGLPTDTFRGTEGLLNHLSTYSSECNGYYREHQCRDHTILIQAGSPLKTPKRPVPEIEGIRDLPDPNKWGKGQESPACGHDPLFSITVMTAEVLGWLEDRRVPNNHH